MNDYLRQLVNDSHNFRFLAETNDSLARSAAAAEELAGKVPFIALALTRVFAERLTKELLRRSGRRDQHIELKSGINQLAAAHIIPRQITSGLHDLRTKGNAALHDMAGDSETARSAVERCFDIGVWWHQFNTGERVTHAFTPRAERETAVNALLESIQAEFAGLRSLIENSSRAGIRISPAGPREWAGGSHVSCAGVTYLVHDHGTRITGTDHAWTLTRADAHSLDRRELPVRLVGLTGSKPASIADGLRAQADVLAAGGRGDRLPKLAGRQRFVLATERLRGPTWTQMFGPGPLPLDPFVVPRALGALAEVAGALTDLHRAGTAHRLLGGDEIVLPERGRGARARDLGLAWLPRLPGEAGAYAAPEQRQLARGSLGPPADVFQLAALLLHTCTGVAPVAGRAFPLRTYHPALPAELDEILARALDPDPARRPSVDAFAAVLRSSREAMLRGATA
ncbi:hypothetical protein Ade02nite_24760 [Paractinoplanes deccanensis]|uniref:Protein kinase domain-containing protein n=1 Tax=Paractinoplanes deccanensis TaxID=113561 RepID=A0ABQ3Y1I5_9ACTN|nr:DUF4145 domain-containing protein [Actinoplanes deccanensis]GID73835.1 hypothetical protein Ade02nite_24760 [Actinoplanes deccanensis]